MCYEQFQHLRPLSGLLELSKQTVDLIKILKFHFHCFEQFQHLKPLSGLFEKSKQTAESNQTADHFKNS